jgi:predicted dinucleotide-binding enzyme
MKKTFGIIGAGNIGRSLAGHLLSAGYKVILSNSKGPDSLKNTITALGEGASAGTPKDAASADIVILALPWLTLSKLPELTDWNGKLVIDATNQYTSFEPLVLADLGDVASSEIVSKTLPGARIVKAFNTLWFKILASNPEQSGGHRVIWISGDDAEAKTEIGEIIDSLGFASVDLGSLAHSKIQEPKGKLGHINLVKVPYDVQP